MRTFTISGHFFDNPAIDDDAEIALPSKVEVCPRCGGHGTHDHPAFSNGVTFDGEDPDFREEYLSGRYDVTCEECGGDNVIAVPDEERLTEEQKAALNRFYKAQAAEAAEARMRARGFQF